MKPYTAFILGVGIAMGGLVPGASGQTKVSELTCSAFLHARGAAQEVAFSAYLEGYVTALHQGLAVTQDSANVRDWCARNPKQMYSEAVSHVVGALERRTEVPQHAEEIQRLPVLANEVPPNLPSRTPTPVFLKSLSDQ
jgi:hypothetical protein